VLVAKNKGTGSEALSIFDKEVVYTGKKVMVKL
jgi:hypothetical protein